MTSHGYHREQHRRYASEGEFKETCKGQAGAVRILEMMGVLENIIVGSIKDRIEYVSKVFHVLMNIPYNTHTYYICRMVEGNLRN